jgi:hypothetical protein
MTDVNSIAATVQKPPQVKLAISLLYAYAVLSILIDLALSILNSRFSIGSLLIQAAIFVVTIFFVSTISKGKVWPRNLLLVFLFLGLCSILYFFPNIKIDLRYQFIISAVRYFLGLIPIAILFLQPAKQWFESFKQHQSKGI